MSDSAKSCRFCLRPKANTECELCLSSLCKRCAESLPKDAFAFLENKPAGLSHSVYCPDCFEREVRAEKEAYDQQYEKAKGVFVYLKQQGEETRLYKRSQRPVKVSACPDREEALLRLAFQAVGLGFNGLLDVDLRSEKVRNGGYQKLIWHGTGIPFQADAERLERDVERAKLRAPYLTELSP